MKNKTRYNARLGARRGVEIVENNSIEAREAFYELMVETAQRDNFFMRSHEYLTAAWQSMLDAGRMHLFFAQFEGRRLAAILVYTFGEKYWYAVGASSNEHRNLMPTYVLQWEVMRWAKQQGITIYDMVAIPNPTTSTRRTQCTGCTSSRWGLGEIAEFLGCLDLPIHKLRAAAWYRFEPLYYRAYQKLKHDVHY
ncbi:MAG: GNAT family N-acetyltransferase [Chloroflexia bacterium]